MNMSWGRWEHTLYVAKSNAITAVGFSSFSICLFIASYVCMFYVYDALDIFNVIRSI